ncbi:hypothetical protein AAGW05_01740 [Arthrobacter sp. LAPM80]|uniref:hypothetical protein n=1 Tax=Arthrobacter sp. LAPM80 TaxID=3141788 RepID=UPI00398B2E21
MTSGTSSCTLDVNFTHELFADPTRIRTPGQRLGNVIEKVTGSTFPDVLQQQILGPLKLGSAWMPGANDPCQRHRLESHLAAHWRRGDAC